MKANTKHPTATLTKSEKQTLERFAAVCGISFDLALVVRDDLALVGLDLPRLGKSRR